MNDYEIGYRKPPKSGQIKKGEVRNPAGRAGKKRRINGPSDHSNGLRTDAELMGDISEEIVVVDGREMTRAEVDIRQQYAKSLKGKATAIRFIDALARRTYAADGKRGGVVNEDWQLWNWGEDLSGIIKEHAAKHPLPKRRRRRAKAKDKLPRRLSEEIFRRIESEVIEIGGRAMASREVRLRAWRAAAQKGNATALRIVERFEAENVAREINPPGVLLVPSELPLEVWEGLVAKQQEQFRTQKIED